MNTPSKKTFEEWFADEQKAGLLDFKIAITPTLKTTTQSICEEILNIEALIAAGRTKELPKPLTFVPLHIENSIRAVCL